MLHLHFIGHMKFDTIITQIFVYVRCNEFFNSIASYDHIARESYVHRSTT